MKVFPHVTGPTCGAHDAILGKLSTSSFKVIVTKDSSTSDVILVFCPIMTRPGADVEATMRKVQGKNLQVLVEADLVTPSHVQGGPKCELVCCY